MANIAYGCLTIEPASENKNASDEFVSKLGLVCNLIDQPEKNQYVFESRWTCEFVWDWIDEQCQSTNSTMTAEKSSLSKDTAEWLRRSQIEGSASESGEKYFERVLKLADQSTLARYRPDNDFLENADFALLYLLRYLAGKTKLDENFELPSGMKVRLDHEGDDDIYNLFEGNDEFNDNPNAKFVYQYLRVSPACSVEQIYIVARFTIFTERQDIKLALGSKHCEIDNVETYYACNQNAEDVPAHQLKQKIENGDVCFSDDIDFLDEDDDCSIIDDVLSGNYDMW